MKVMIRQLLFAGLLVILAGDRATAQLCNGSLGDPVVNITFGSGPNRGQPLGSSVVSYTYSSDDCFNDGYYTIANSMPSCFADTWFALPQDHTPGDTAGYMMVINASFNPGDFFVKRVSGLCGGVTYEFACWILNLLRPGSCYGNAIDANVTFRIETLSGATLLTYTTGTIASSPNADWKQYGAFFTMPANLSDVVIRLTNNSIGGCGNDLVLDDITFRPCGKLVKAAVNGAATAYNICSGEAWNVHFTTDAVPGGNVAYQWQRKGPADAAFADIAGATGVAYTPVPANAPGAYLYRLSFSDGTQIGTASCRIVSNEISVFVNPYPAPVVQVNSPVCEGDDIVLSASGGLLYSWTGPGNYTSHSADSVLRHAGFNNAGLYKVAVTSDKNCTSYDSAVVIVDKKPIVHIANAAASFCEGDSVQLAATASGTQGYYWQPVSGLSDSRVLNPVAGPVQTTWYTFTGTNGACGAVDSVLMTVYKKPYAQAGPDKQLTEGERTLLQGTAGGTDVTIRWQPGAYLNDASVAQPIANPPADTTYTLHVTSNRGCGSSTDEVFVKVYKNIVIPNAFSPNHDGVNDSWIIRYLDGYSDGLVTVFNRYGQPVFSSYKVYKPWDGTNSGLKLPPGTYYYIIDLPIIHKRYSGWVQLL